MINDLTPASNDILKSLYADDSSTYTSGNNTTKMYKSLQTTLTKYSPGATSGVLNCHPQKANASYSQEAKNITKLITHFT